MPNADGISSAPADQANSAGNFAQRRRDPLGSRGPRKFCRQACPTQTGSNHCRHRSPTQKTTKRY
eukprot:5626474-Prymnesium_polylepis.1